MAHEFGFFKRSLADFGRGTPTFGERGLVPMINADQIPSIHVQVSGPTVTVVPAPSANNSTPKSTDNT